MSQIFLFISVLMSGFMLIVIGLLGRRKSVLRARYTALLGLAGGSFGIFFATAVNEVINYGRSYHPDFLILCGIILGFLLSVLVGIIFVWPRASTS